MALLEVKNLKTHFFTKRGVVKAVDGITFEVDRGETMGLVGESGCGKSIACLSIIRLVPEPGRQVAGEILFAEHNLSEKTNEEMRAFRGKHISMILQDPMTALNPVFRVGSQVSESMHLHRGLNGKALLEEVKRILGLVRIGSPEVCIRSYPHELSGGMRQRVVGAIAISCEPDLLIADEPTTSLDVTIQAQYLKLIKEIQKQTGLAVIFITHDFGIVANVCDSVAVMYAGKIVEKATVGELFQNPAHPYTRALMDSVPKVEVDTERLAYIEGEPPNLWELPPGCRFEPRCRLREKRCQEDPEPLEVKVDDRHWVSCWKYN